MPSNLLYSAKASGVTSVDYDELNCSSEGNRKACIIEETAFHRGKQHSSDHSDCSGPDADSRHPSIDDPSGLESLPVNDHKLAILRFLPDFLEGTEIELICYFSANEARRKPDPLT